ncbi:RNB-domain-containing protein [Pisolithus marmoratus]|nr:RNB-domain-containing protein [Pisolithus marmoratus]
MRPLPLRARVSAPHRASNDVENDKSKLSSELPNAPLSLRKADASNTRAPVNRSLSVTRKSRQGTDEDVAELTTVAHKLVRTAARTQLFANQGWNHAKSLRGDDVRIESALKAAATRKNALKFRASPDSAGEEVLDLPAEESSVPHQIPTGTFVEIRKGSLTTTGIVIRNALIEGRNFSVTLTITGHVIEHPESDAGLVSGPCQVIARKPSARVEILKQLREFEREVANAYSGIQATNLNLYDLVRSKDLDEWSTVTVPEAAKLIVRQRRQTVASLFAMHRYLMKHSEEFAPQISTHRLAQTFDVRPLSHLEKLRAVKHMIRSASPAIDAFARKARSIMAVNRQRRIESWDEPPKRTVASDINYTTEDRLILDVLQHALRRHRDVVTDPYALIVASVLKTLQVDADVIDTVVLREVLIDLGHLAPWEDLVSRRKEYELDQLPDNESPRVAAQNLIVKRNLAVRPIAGSSQPLGPEDFYPRDPVEHLRHDFGDMPVYVVDDIGAEELDDGLSIEEIPIRAGFGLDTCARRRSHCGHSTNARLCPASIPKGDDMLSLGACAKSGKPELVLTFSFKIDTAGHMVDYQVRPGFVRNLQIIDYDSVDRLAGFPNLKPAQPFDPGCPPNITTVTTEPIHVQNLRLLADTVTRHRLRNLRFSDAFVAVIPYARTSIVEKPLHATPLCYPKSFRFTGFPTIKYQVLSQKIQEAGSRMVVAECMKAACRVASRWFLEHNVPMLRRTSKPPVCLSDPDAFSKVLEARDPDGFVDFYLAQKANLHVPPVEHTLDPGMHWSMGVPEGEGYIRVTSPLRRYSDLVAHWQIKDALLRPGASPLFSREWLTKYGPEIKEKERVFKEAERTHYAYWTALYLKRFMENPHTAMVRPNNPLDGLTGTILSHSFVDRQGGSARTMCHVPVLGIKAIVTLPPGTIMPDIGDSLDVRLSDIQVGLGSKVHVLPK